MKNLIHSYHPTQKQFYFQNNLQNNLEATNEEAPEELSPIEKEGQAIINKLNQKYGDIMITQDEEGGENLLSHQFIINEKQGPQVYEYWIPSGTNTKGFVTLTGQPDSESVKKGRYVLVMGMKLRHKHKTMEEIEAYLEKEQREKKA